VPEPTEALQLVPVARDELNPDLDHEGEQAPQQAVPELKQRNAVPSSQHAARQRARVTLPPG
jgi:hypothetical protein